MRIQLLLLALAASFAFAEPKAISLTLGKGQLLSFGADIQRVGVAEPKVADCIVVSPREVMINAKGIGRTTVIVWEIGGGPSQYEIRVMADTADLDAVRDEIHRVAGDGITISGNDQTLVLTGLVKDADESKRAQAIASTHSKTVTNLLHTPPPPELRQIMLEVKFASIDRDRLSQWGFNLFSTNAAGRTGGIPR